MYIKYLFKINKRIHFNLKMRTANATLAAGYFGLFKMVWASFELYPQFNTSRGCMRVFKVSNILNIYNTYIYVEINDLCKM